MPICVLRKQMPKTKLESQETLVVIPVKIKETEGSEHLQTWMEVLHL
jgi:hypothetical protein